MVGARKGNLRVFWDEKGRMGMACKVVVADMARRSFLQQQDQPA